MDIDFSFWLVLATFVAGVIALLDRLWLARRRDAALSARLSGGREVGEAERAQILREPVVVEYAKSFFPVLALVLVLRSFLGEPFTIPSGSMLPSLQVGDYILVNKYAYGLRLPVVGTRVLDIGEPQRGDVMVFRYPRHPSTSYIKRVVGLPGDVIAYRAGALYINGTLVPQELHERLPLAQGGWTRVIREQLGEHPHWMRRDEGREPFGPAWALQVPPGHYFVMGDNRDNSNDSRAWGFVPDKLVTGKAVYIWMHKQPGWNLPTFARNGVIDRPEPPQGEQQ